MIALTFDTESLTDDERKKSEKSNIPKILKLLEKNGIKATFFVSGKVAENFPELIKDISKKGHEIASHSYNHVRLADLSLQQQKEEIRKGKEVLENLISKKVIGFRAPYLSFTNETFWILKKEGFIYDSSVHEHLTQLPLTELSCFLPDDFNIFESAQAVGTEKHKIRKWIETRKKMIDSLKWYEINVQLCHPWVIAKNSERLKALDIFIRYILNKNIDVKTCHDIIKNSL
jgi:peptidoglycan/xylan/chitin deacetylase (PgdA/CDA1 family)